MTDAPMTLSAFQDAARRTINPSLDPDRQLLDAVAGLAEEAGEALGAVRKHLFQAKPLDRDALIEELGDALWCVAAAATVAGVTLDEVARRNVEKLRTRYPDGFSPRI